MIPIALLTVAFVCTTPASMAAPVTPAASAPATRTSGVVSLSLIEALVAVGHPQLAGVFSFVPEADAPFAWADFLARDKRSLKLYLKKLQADRKTANGLTDWDHAVCASLVNLYASPLAATFGVPDAKRMTQINECVLTPVVSLEEIVARRKK